MQGSCGHPDCYGGRRRDRRPDLSPTAGPHGRDTNEPAPRPAHRANGARIVTSRCTAGTSAPAPFPSLGAVTPRPAPGSSQGPRRERRTASHRRPGRPALRVDARLVLGEHQSVDVPVHLAHRSDDPLAVALEFLGPAAEAGTWHFSRDLLWEGLHQPTGLGDVRIWPPCTCHARASLRVMLRNRADIALIGLPTRQVRRWLRRESFALVPQGTEHTRIDWTAELYDLTG
ncbi:SsgA family sporulation/cell division regulator [Kitasatospora sp. NPDC054795]